jgi:hypothetical protein
VISRRSFLRGGCTLAFLAPIEAEAAPVGTPAPRRACPHTGCRYHRADDDGGICALSLYGPVAEVDT